MLPARAAAHAAHTQQPRTRTSAGVSVRAFHRAAPPVSATHSPPRRLVRATLQPTLRFAAVRTLNKVAMAHPSVVMKCNEDMESLITDSNRSIATLAITTLLKTGSENSVERLMKQISSFISEIGDEFKIVVVQVRRTTRLAPSHPCRRAPRLCRRPCPPPRRARRAAVPPHTAACSLGSRVRIST